MTARLAATRAVLLTAAAVAVLLSGACGREDIELSHFTADASGEGAANEGGGFGEGGFSPCDRDGGGRPCHGIGEACSLAGECCSGRCETGSCMPKGACAVPGAACTTRADCCSGSCEPVPGTAARQCTDFCKREGEACARAQDCCSLGCKSGVCGATLCSREGSDCTTGADCCSGLCDSDKKCTLDTKAGCRATGEDCNSGGGASCCGTCVNNRCDLGPGACRPLDAPCDVAADCCTGACTQGAGNVKRCTGACIDTGGACQTTADCCSGTSCTGSPSTCTSPTSVCKLQGDTCAADGECCSLQCLLGRCGDNCPVLK